MILLARIYAIVIIVFALLCSVMPVSAQTARTTPVEVKNQVQIDPAANTVKSSQQGTWTVGITGTPSVSILSMPSVNVVGTPNVNVANTPSVNIANTPNVSITNTPTVTTQTKSNLVKPFAGGQIAPGEYVESGLINCAGFKEIRVLINTSHTSPDITAAIHWVALGHSVAEGVVKLDKTGTLIQGATSQPMKAFTMPALSDQFWIRVTNGTTYQIGLSGVTSWVYMVN